MQVIYTAIFLIYDAIFTGAMITTHKAWRGLYPAEAPMKKRTRYKFSHQAGGYYFWYSETPVAPNDSRYECVSCHKRWFWEGDKNAGDGYGLMSGLTDREK